MLINLINQNIFVKSFLKNTCERERGMKQDPPAILLWSISLSFTKWLNAGGRNFIPSIGSKRKMDHLENRKGHGVSILRPTLRDYGG
jgi:hypothetical protein